MEVLVAEVDTTEDDVLSLTINRACASDRAVKEDQKVDTINLEESLFFLAAVFHTIYSEWA